jgi:GT2 family glycosyltransferase
MEKPLIFIVILNWNGKDVIKNCLNSVENIDYPNFQTVVVDNGSNDGSQNLIKLEFPRVLLIENEKNMGVAEGNNIGIKFALKMGAEYIFILVNDIIVDSNILNILLFEHKYNNIVGIVAPIVLDMGNREYIQENGNLINWKKGRAYLLDRGNIKDVHPIKREVDYVGLPFINANIIDTIGYYDPKYFVYWEDADFCIRVKRAGYKIISVPDAKIWHKLSYTTKKVTGFYEYHITRNMFWFMKKFANKLDYTIFLIYFFGFRVLFMSALFLIYYRDIQSLKYYYKGIIDGIR